jgi:hypothetical protein
MAAPYVSGLLALMQVRFPNDTFQQRIRRVIEETDPLPSLVGKCVSVGRVNLRRTLGLPAEGTNPCPPPQFSLLSRRGEWPLRLRLSGQPGQAFAIEVSNGLTEWTPVLTNTVWSDGSLVVTDPSPRVYPQHYFRARLMP